MAEETNMHEKNGVGTSNNSNQGTYTVYYDLYDHGFINGIMRIPREAFSQFLNHLGKRDLSKKELGITLEEIKVLEDKIKQNRDKRLELENVISASKWEIEATKEFRDWREKTIIEKQTEYDNIQEERDLIPIEYNWTNVVLFITMGAIFMVSDYFITLDVMHKGLSLKISYAIALALAMSAITFIIKPTIDRMFEKPYLRGDNKNKHRLLLSVSLASILVLGLLGYFREVHMKTDSKIEKTERSITSNKEKIKSLSNRKDRLSSSNNVSVINSINQEIDQLKAENQNLEKKIGELTEKRENSRVLLLIFILSNILFAVAAAICLSIAFPAADKLRYKSRLSKKLKQLEEFLQIQRIELNNLIEKAQNTLTERDKAGNELKLLPSLSDMEATLIQLQSISKILLQRIATHDTEADISLYQEAYERGGVCELSDKIVINPPQLTAVWVGRRRPGGAPPGKPPIDRESGGNFPADSGYLHQQIRKIIEYNHQKNKNLLNGEE